MSNKLTFLLSWTSIPHFELSEFNVIAIAIGLNPRMYKVGRGAVVVTPLWVLCFFVLDDKTSEPDVFINCLFIPWAHFERSLVIVSYYGFEIWRHK